MPRKKKTEEIGQLDFVKETPKQQSKQQDKKEEKETPLTFQPSYFGGKRINVPYENKISNGAFLPKGHLQIEIIGCQGSGKQTYLLSLIPQLKLSQIAIFSLIIGNPVYKEIEKYCKQSGIEYFFSSDIDEAKSILENMVEKKSDNDYGLIVFDDFNEMTTQRTNPYMKIVNMVNGMFRNFRFHIGVIQQQPTNIQTLFRTNANTRVLFKTNEKFGLESIKKDFVINTGHSEDDFDELYSIVRKVPFSFLQINQDDKIFIYVNGQMNTLQEVDFSDNQDLKNDDELNKLCSAYVLPQKTSMDVRKHNQVKSKLVEYIKYLINTKIDKEKIEQYCKQKYGIEF